MGIDEFRLDSEGAQFLEQCVSLLEGHADDFPADVAARVFEWLHREAVRRDEQLHIVVRQLHARGIDTRVEAGAGEAAHEQFIDQFAHHAATVAVGQ